MICEDFTGKPLKKGDWVIRAVGYGSNSAQLVYSRLEEDPHPHKTREGRWAFWIRTYHWNGFGGKGKAENHDTMIKIEEADVPKEILKAYEEK